MSRLIDADNLNFEGQKYNKSQLKAILDFIDNQPTVFDKDKVLDELKNTEQKYRDKRLCCKKNGKIWDEAVFRHMEDTIGIAITIVKRGEEV